MTLLDLLLVAALVCLCSAIAIGVGPVPALAVGSVGCVGLWFLLGES